MPCGVQIFLAKAQQSTHIVESEVIFPAGLIDRPVTMNAAGFKDVDSWDGILLP